MLMLMVLSHVSCFHSFCSFESHSFSAGAVVVMVGSDVDRLPMTRASRVYTNLVKICKDMNMEYGLRPLHLWVADADVSGP